MNDCEAELCNLGRDGLASKCVGAVIKDAWRESLCCGAYCVLSCPYIDQSSAARAPDIMYDCLCMTGDCGRMMEAGRNDILEAGRQEESICCEPEWCGILYGDCELLPGMLYRLSRRSIIDAVGRTM